LDERSTWKTTPSRRSRSLPGHSTPNMATR
jgi:hypothetical protein